MDRVNIDSDRFGTATRVANSAKFPLVWIMVSKT